MVPRKGDGWMNHCGSQRYENINRQQVDAMLKALRKNGAAVFGDNPWEVDSHQSGVRLRGRLNEVTSDLEVSILGRDWYVPSSMVWQKIDELIHYIRTTPEAEMEFIKLSL
jgi:hypothetical protein